MIPGKSVITPKTLGERSTKDPHHVDLATKRKKAKNRPYGSPPNVPPPKAQSLYDNPDKNNSGQQSILRDKRQIPLPKIKYL